MNVNSGSRRPDEFYHGTQTAIHKLTEPYLDPSRAKHFDEGDPETSHVFVTPNRRQAEIFSMKTEEVLEIVPGSDGGIIIYSRFPASLRGGWLYTCPEDPARPFREIILRGRRTDKWVSSARVPVIHPTFVSGLASLAQRGLRVYVLGEGMDAETWTDMSRSCDGARHDLNAFYRHNVLVGNLRRVRNFALPAARCTCSTRGCRA